MNGEIVQLPERNISLEEQQEQEAERLFGQELEERKKAQEKEPVKSDEPEKFKQFSDWSQKDKEDRIAMLRGPDFDEWLESAKNEPKPLDIGIRLPDGSPLEIPSIGISGVFGCTGHGKSTLLLNIIRHLLGQGETVVYYQYEERLFQVLAKLMLSIAYGDATPINKNPMKTISEFLKTGKINTEFVPRDSSLTADEHEAKLQVGFDKVRSFLKDGKLIVSSSDRRAPDGFELANDIRALGTLKDDKRPRLIVLDYVQLIEPKPDDRSHNRQYEVKAICRELLKSSNEVGIPLLLAGQFNRQASASHERLTLDKIGEAGDIERTISCAIAVWNHAKPGQDANGNMRTVDESKKDQMSITVLKNRDGETLHKPIVLNTNLANRFIELGESKWLDSGSTSSDGGNGNDKGFVLPQTPIKQNRGIGR